MHVAIIGLGPSSNTYVEICKRMGDRHRFCDETWVINAFGGVLEHDLVFHMDDVRTQIVRAAAAPDSNIAAMLGWMRKHPGPIVTSIAHADFPGLVEFPLEDVLNEFPEAYFNSTAAYAVAYAIHKGAEKISVFGVDFTYPDVHDAERGRACVEFWLGVATQRGIKIAVPRSTSLFDALHTQADRFYGYDFVDLSIDRGRDGRIRVGMKEHGKARTAEEIERAYDHGQHPNRLCAA